MSDIDVEASKELTIEEQVRQFIDFDGNLYLTLTSLAMQMDIGEEEEFQKFVDAIGIDESWVRYYKVLLDNMPEEELGKMMEGVNKMFSIEEDCFNVLSSRIEDYLNNLNGGIPEEVLH